MSDRERVVSQLRHLAKVRASNQPMTFVNMTPVDAMTENKAANQIESDAKRIAELEADKAKLTVLVDELRHQIVGEWQPIETAPKDKVILLGLPIRGNLTAEDRRVFEGRWHERQATWTSVNGFLILEAATKWKPLPAPPIDAATQEQGK